MIKPAVPGSVRRTLSSPAPEYPASAIPIRMSGAAAVFELLVAADGAVLDAKSITTVRSLPATNGNRIELPGTMRQAMIAAMMARRFEPIPEGVPRYAEHVTVGENAALDDTASWTAAYSPDAFEKLLRLADSYDAAMAALEQHESAGGAPPIPRVFEGGPIPKPRKVRDALPVYPPIAASARVQGVVMLDLVIEPTDRVSSATVVRSMPLLDRAAIDACLQWEFEPAQIGGQPATVRDTVVVRFRLK